MVSVPAHSAPQSSRRIVALDGLRGVAALMVLFHHTLLTLPDFANYEWGRPGATDHGVVEWLLIRTPLRLLWAGQERALLFFVLSGFVLGLPWLQGRAAPYGRFLLGRFCRIYPPYLAAMLVAAVGSVVLGGVRLDRATVYFNQLGWSFHLSWLAFPSIVAILNNPSSRYMNEAVWSLVWEARVALIFPFIVIPIVRWRNTGIGLVLLVLAIVRHLGTVLMPPSLNEVLNVPQDTFYYAEYFVLGTAVAANRDAIAAWFGRSDQHAGPCCLIAGCLICWLPWPWHHDQIIGIGAAIILASIAGSDRVGSWLGRPSFIWLGRQSYSLFLIHLPVIMAVIIAFHGSVPVAACVAIVPLAIAVAEGFHRWVERPSVALAQHLTGYSRRPKPIARSIAASAGAIAAP